MQNGRKRIPAIAATLTTLVTALVVVGIGFATPSATAKPDLATVKKQVEKYDHLAEQASERYNDAQVKLDQTRTKLGALNSDLARQQQVVDAMREQVASMVVDQYQGDALSTTSQVVLSRNPDAFLANLNAVSAYNNQRGEVMKEFSTQLDRLKLRKAAVKAEADRLSALQKKMAAEKADIDEKAAKAQDLLDHLEAEARAKILSGGWTGDIPDVAASGRAAAAVRFAMAQVGKAYVYGAAGPNAYDCSGLTMRAWGMAGVGLPHSSSAQQGSGTRVSESELQPGDLVFYYSPVSHVGMYIGNGLIVNALNPSSGVRVSALHSMPYSGAVRPG
ncbi:peptidoglycan DL-endopeptidase CwlO [Marmoricola sp. URHA0025 HA25]